MQAAFDFGGGEDIARIRRELARALGRPDRATERLDPVSQLARSLIGSRTRDPVSRAAFERLRHRYPGWAGLIIAAPRDVEAVIEQVTFADLKARYLGETLRTLVAERGAFDLDFLGGWPVAPALAWLEHFPGVGTKVAAATLNFSTLDKAAFVVDTHVLRVLRRFGFIGERADTWKAYTAVMAATPGWTATDLAELHALLKRLGQVICKAEYPACRFCPLRALGCRTGRRFSTQECATAEATPGG